MKITRSAQFAFRVTPAEMKAIKRSARAARIPAAAFVRQTLFAALAKQAGKRASAEDMAA